MGCKHDWNERGKRDPVFGTPIRTCKKCGRKEKLVVVNALTGARRWKIA
jgi:hypothetical protein